MSAAPASDAAAWDYTPSREPALWLVCLLHALLNIIPIRGITIWYDEAWRMLVAVGATSWSHFFGRWFAHGLPIPVSLPYLLIIRLVHGSVGLPLSEYILRGANVLASFVVLHALWTITARWTGSRRAGLAAALLLAVNPYFGYYVFSIKEHVFLVALLALWARRIQRLVMSFAPTTVIDILACWGLVLFSPLAASAIGAVVAWLFAAKLFGRPRRFDWALVLVGAFPAALWTVVQLKCVAMLERDFQQFCTDYGLEQLGPGALYGTENTTLSDLPARLLALGGAPGDETALTLPAGTVWIIGLALAALLAIQHRSRRAAIVFGAALFAPATFLFFQLATGVIAPRMVLWLAPPMAAAAAAVFSDPSLKPRVAGAALYAMLLIATCLGWIHWWKIYPAKRRYPEFIANLGALSFDRSRDVVLHTQGLLYYPHAVFDPAVKKAIFPLPEEGTAMMTLHPACPVLGGFPVDPVWNDTDLRRFDGGAAWAATNYVFSPGMIAHMRRDLFNGDNRLDTFVDWPYCWVRVGRNEPAGL